MGLFRDPATLVAFYDPHYYTGQHKLYPWQVRVLSDFAFRAPGQTVDMMVVAPNGGGKSGICMAAPAVWTAVSFYKSQTAITSASKDQLDVQTMRAVKALARYMNEYHQAELWDISHRRLEFRPTQSVIDARKSDEEGTQEGFHPLVPGGEFTILVDEGKSIPDEIYNGILKWTGCTRRMDVTSAGDPQGVFYRNWCHGRQIKHHIMWEDCPHLGEADRERIIVSSGGLETPLAQQVIYSRFVALAGTVIIPLEAVEKCLRLAAAGAIEHKKEPFNRAGLDLSGGGDETVVSVWNGNKQIAVEVVPFVDELKIEDHIALVIIPKYDLRLEHIWADAGGIGRRMVKGIRERVLGKFGGRFGDKINMVYNQSPPSGVLKKNFGNRGTESWYHVGALIQNCAILPLPDPTQKEQLANRYFRQQVSSDKIIAEPKSEARAQRGSSPDRADAMVLALCRYHPEGEKEEPEPRQKRMTGEELAAWMERLAEGEFAEESRTGALTLEHLVGTGSERR